MGYGLLRMIPGGLTKLSSAGGPYLLRRTCVGTRSQRSSQARPLWRAAGAPEPGDFSRCSSKCVTPRDTATAPGPRHRNASRRAPKLGPRRGGL